MPQLAPLLESLETRTLLAANVSDPSCPVFSAELFVSTQPHCALSELDSVEDEVASGNLLRPTGTSKIDHYPESKGWFGDLWDYALAMLGWS